MSQERERSRSPHRTRGRNLSFEKNDPSNASLNYDVSQTFRVNKDEVNESQTSSVNENEVYESQTSSVNKDEVYESQNSIENENELHEREQIIDVSDQDLPNHSAYREPDCEAQNAEQNPSDRYQANATCNSLNKEFDHLKTKVNEKVTQVIDFEMDFFHRSFMEYMIDAVSNLIIHSFDSLERTVLREQDLETSRSIADIQENMLRFTDDVVERYNSSSQERMQEISRSFYQEVARNMKDLEEAVLKSCDPSVELFRKATRKYVQDITVSFNRELQTELIPELESTLVKNRHLIDMEPSALFEVIRVIVHWNSKNFSESIDANANKMNPI